jgi:hypothetical protein
MSAVADLVKVIEPHAALTVRDCPHEIFVGEERLELLHSSDTKQRRVIIGPDGADFGKFDTFSLTELLVPLG